MKVVITGHTRGLGLELYKVFSDNGYEVEGYSRSNGFDISNGLDVDADIFINNAYAPKAQTDLLQHYIDKWQGTNKLIINISSKIVYFPPAENSPEIIDTYLDDKNKQNTIISDRYTLNTPRIMNIVPGLIDTDMAAIFDAQKMKAKDVALFIFSLVNLQNSINVQSVLFDVPGLDWNDIKLKK
jgi:hypothetical protein